jgi:hypothetical protein
MQDDKTNETQTFFKFDLTSLGIIFNGSRFLGQADDF